MKLEVMMSLDARMLSTGYSSNISEPCNVKISNIDAIFSSSWKNHLDDDLKLTLKNQISELPLDNENGREIFYKPLGTISRFMEDLLLNGQSTMNVNEILKYARVYTRVVETHFHLECRRRLAAEKQRDEALSRNKRTEKREAEVQANDDGSNLILSKLGQLTSEITKMSQKMMNLEEKMKIVEHKNDSPLQRKKAKRNRPETSQPIVNLPNDVVSEFATSTGLDSDMEPENWAIVQSRRKQKLTRKNTIQSVASDSEQSNLQKATFQTDDNFPPLIQLSPSKQPGNEILRAPSRTDRPRPQRMRYRDIVLKNIETGSNHRVSSSSKLIISQANTADVASSSNEILERLRKEKFGRAEQIRIIGMQPVAGNRVLINLKDAQEADRCKKVLCEKFNDVIVSEPKARNPLIRVCGVPCYMSGEELVEDLIHYNDCLKGTNTSSIRPAFTKKPRSLNPWYRENFQDYVIEVTPEVCKKLLELGRVQVTHLTVRTVPYSRFIQCNNCLKFGHTKGGKYPCRQKPRCEYCAGEHNKKECENRTQLRCANCLDYNKRYASVGAADPKILKNINHDVRSRQCPLLQKNWEQTEAMTNYH